MHRRRCAYLTLCSYAVTRAVRTTLNSVRFSHEVGKSDLTFWGLVIFASVGGGGHGGISSGS